VKSRCKWKIIWIIRIRNVDKKENWKARIETAGIIFSRTVVGHTRKGQIRNTKSRKVENL
jgi:hypothetical protein